MKIASINKDIITIKFQANSKNEFHFILGTIKTIEGARFFRDEKAWRFPKTNYAINTLKICGFIFENKNEKEIIKSIRKRKGEIPKSINPSGLKKKLWTFQEKGVGFIDSRNGNALVADEMRVGKTAQVLGWLHHRNIPKYILIICDVSAKLVWAKMITDFLPKKDAKLQILQGRSLNPISEETRFIIVNYESLYMACPCEICEGKKKVFNRKCSHCKGKGKIAKLRADIQNLPISTIIIDEAQKIRNIGTYYTKIIMSLGKQIKYKIATTGTPIESRPDEFYNVISLIKPSLFPSRWDFRKRYCGLYHDGFGWKYNGATNTEELHRILTETIMIRRLRKEVSKDIPEKMRSLIPIEFDESCKHDYKITSKTLSDMESNSQNALAKYEYLKQIAVQGKMKGVIQWLKEFLEEGKESNKKLIVYAIHKKVIKILHEHFKEISTVLDGSTSGTIKKDGMSDRKRAEIAFQTDPKIRLFIGNLDAAGKAICLDAANDVAVIEFSFLPGRHLQAEDRPIHMKKKGGYIYAWYLIAKDTIEEDIFEVLDKKCKILGQILDGKNVKEKSIFGELLEKLKEREDK